MGVAKEIAFYCLLVPYANLLLESGMRPFLRLHKKIVGAEVVLMVFLSIGFG